MPRSRNREWVPPPDAVLGVIQAFDSVEVKTLKSTDLDTLKERIRSCTALSPLDRVLVIGVLGYVQATNAKRRSGRIGGRLKDKNGRPTSLLKAMFVVARLRECGGKIETAITEVTGHHYGSKEFEAVKRWPISARKAKKISKEVDAILHDL